MLGKKIIIPHLMQKQNLTGLLDRHWIRWLIILIILSLIVVVKHGKAQEPPQMIQFYVLDSGGNQINAEISGFIKRGSITDTLNPSMIRKGDNPYYTVYLTHDSIDYAQMDITYKDEVMTLSFRPTSYPPYEGGYNWFRKFDVIFKANILLICDNSKMIVNGDTTDFIHGHGFPVFTEKRMISEFFVYGVTPFGKIPNDGFYCPYDTVKRLCDCSNNFNEIPLPPKRPWYVDWNKREIINYKGQKICKLMDGKVYAYDENGLLIQTFIFKDGKYIGRGVIEE